MTNVLLSMIGIILAALSALLMMDYGGSYFVASAAKADASSLTSAGQNVYAAYSMYDDRHRAPAASMNDLLSSNATRSLLSSVPMVRSGQAEPAWRDFAMTGVPHKAFAISNVSYNACAAVNLIVNKFPDPMAIPTTARFTEGCFSDNGVYVYYRLLDGQAGAAVPLNGTPGRLDFG